MLPAWTAYLPTRRWFQAKGLDAAVTELTPLPWLAREAGLWLRSELATVRHAEGCDTYHLLVAYVAAGQGEPEAVVGTVDLEGFGAADVLDAPRSPAALAVVARALAAAPGVTWSADPPDPAWPAETYTGEQSNTNIRLGPGYLLKLLRKTAPGRGLDPEVLAALTGSGITPDLYGLWRDEARDLDLGFCCQLVQGARDGWVWANEACRAGRDVGPELAALGRTLRRLHELLAAAFPTGLAAGAEIRARMLVRLEAAVAELPELASYQAGLRSALSRVGDGDVAVQRLHGDFHLGQALVAGAGGAAAWTILDFEGEPLKTPAERRALDSPWRDVAGLLRSIDYCRSSRPEPEAPAAVAWAASARAAFLAGYLGVGVAPALLGAYEADKAIYEFIYETRNRPNWVAIPRRALAALSS
jgi:maltokinase